MTDAAVSSQRGQRFNLPLPLPQGEGEGDLTV
jgi:hypothetical protein